MDMMQEDTVKNRMDTLENSAVEEIVTIGPRCSHCACARHASESSAESEGTVASTTTILPPIPEQYGREIESPPTPKVMQTSPSTQGTDCNKCVCIASIIMTVLVFSALSACLVFFVNFYDKYNQPKYKLCFPCKVGGESERRFTDSDPSIERTEALTDRNANGMTMCCSRNRRQDGVMESQNSENDRTGKESAAEASTHRPGFPRGTTVFPDKIRPAAHLVLTDIRNTSRDEKNLYLVDGWSSNKRYQAVLQQCRYMKGRLIIQQTGLYYVYNQIHFLERPTGGVTGGSHSHFIYKYNRELANGGNWKILQTATSRCGDSHSFSQSASYLGGVVRLQNHDQVYVKVNNLKAVHKNRYSTFFGLYYIGQ